MNFYVLDKHIATLNLKNPEVFCVKYDRVLQKSIDIAERKQVQQIMTTNGFASSRLFLQIMMGLSLENKNSCGGCQPSFQPGLQFQTSTDLSE